MLPSDTLKQKEHLFHAVFMLPPPISHDRPHSCDSGKVWPRSLRNLSKHRAAAPSVGNIATNRDTQPSTIQIVLYIIVCVT